MKAHCTKGGTRSERRETSNRNGKGVGERNGDGDGDGNGNEGSSGDGMETGTGAETGTARITGSRIDRIREEGRKESSGIGPFHDRGRVKYLTNGVRPRDN